MKNKKKWYSSLTIVSQLMIIILIGFTVWMVLSIPALDYDFTADELYNWAYATSQNQKILILQMLIISLSLIGIYGRLRAKKSIGKKD